MSLFEDFEPPERGAGRWDESSLGEETGLALTGASEGGGSVTDGHTADSAAERQGADVGSDYAAITPSDEEIARAREVLASAAVDVPTAADSPRDDVAQAAAAGGEVLAPGPDGAAFAAPSALTQHSGHTDSG